MVRRRVVGREGGWRDWLVYGRRPQTTGGYKDVIHTLFRLGSDDIHSIEWAVKDRALVIAPRVYDIATTQALRYMARTKQRRTYLPYTFPAVAGTHLPTPKGWRIE